MDYLIDGYNLMHAIGLATRSMPAAQFAQARTRFLDWLAAGADQRANLLVIFDAQDAPSPSLDSSHRGVRFRFAFGRTADDLIEEMLAEEAHPEVLAVVSNDGRVREAARRAGCGTHSCEEFVDWLVGGKREQGPDDSSPPEKPEPTEADVDELLNIFSKPKRKQ